MPSLNECLDQAVAAGRITQKESDQVATDLNEIERQLTIDGKMSPEAARLRAQQVTIDNRRKATAKKRRDAALQTIKIHQALQQMESHPRGRVAGLIALMVKDAETPAGYSNIDNRATTIIAQSHAMFAESLDKMRRRKLGLSQNHQVIRNFAKEAYGTNTGDASAKAIAKQWEAAAEFLRQRFNRAGGAIPKLREWGMPQHHDPLLVGKAGKEKWLEFVVPRLDRNRILNEALMPMSDDDFTKMMDEMYLTIKSNGASDLIPGQRGESKLANRRQDHRVLPFKNADGWLEYHDQFGSQDIFATLTDHITGMANDIAKLEILGPNPNAAYRYLKDVAIKKGDLVGGPEREYIDWLWNTVSGRAQVAESVKWADRMSATRNLLTSAQLGGAFLSAVSDISFIRQTAKFNGLSAMKVLQRQMSLMNPANAEDRLFAVKLGLTAEAWATHALAANRFVEITGAGKAAKAADFVMRASLLSPWTDAGRKAFGMEFMNVIGERMAQRFDEFSPELRRAFEGYGITADEWEVLRNVELIEFKGAKYFSVENLMKNQMRAGSLIKPLDEQARIDLVTKVQEMILTERDFAVPMPDARVRAMLTLGTQRGTVAGEITRAVGQYKSFPVTIMTTHLARGAAQQGINNKAKYLASLAIATTVMGAVALQAKDIQRGRDPRNMDTADFWLAAFIQGGGAGIFGDFIYSGVHGMNRYGKSIWETMGGPTTSMMADFARVFAPIANGDFEKVAARGTDFVTDYMPGRSLWYTRLAFERWVEEGLQQAVDPKADEKLRRAIKKRRTEYEQDYWWRPGEGAPRRSPAN